MIAEKGYELSYDEIAETRKEVMQQGLLLDYPREYWLKFVKDGTLDKAALLKAGYDGDGQPDWIEAEMLKLGWVEGGEVVPFEHDPSRVPYKAPLSERKQAEAMARVVVVNDVIQPSAKRGKRDRAED